MNLARAISIGTLVVAALVPSSAGAGESDVRYSGDSLIVGDASYARRTLTEMRLPGDTYERGAVYVGEKPGQRAALEKRLDELGLTDRRRDELTSQFVVRVPDGWEDQWVRALLTEPHVQFAWINFAIRCC